MRRAIVTALLGLGALGCTEPKLGSARDALAAAQRRWAAAALSNYDFTAQRLCFCADAVTRPVTVQVRGGSLAGIVYADSGTAADTSMFTAFLTIDRLFGFLRQQLDAMPDTLVAAYDPRLGYPASAFVDPHFQTADDEFSLQVTALNPATAAVAR
jgi:hypothetical protein